jgi:iron complex outermembrane receptor protein
VIRCQRHRRRAFAWIFCAITGLIAAAHPLNAQQTADERTAAAATALEEITVTARRRDEREQTIPMAITAFSQADLDLHHIDQFSDLAKLTPSLTVVTNGSDLNSLYAGQVRIRGLPGAEVYFAEVPVGSTDRPLLTGLSHSLSPGYYFDLESVEIDKGAQGTFFGRPSIGGLIAIAPRHPTDRFEGYIQTEFGDYGDKKNEFALNLPIVDDKLIVRVAGLMQQRDGYTRDLQDGQYLDNQNYYAWRIGVTLKPSDDFENYFLYDGYWQDSAGSSEFLIDANPDKIIARFNASFMALPPGTMAGCAYTVTLGGPATGPIGNLPGACGATRIGLEPGIGAALATQQALGPRTVAGRYSSGIGKDYFYGFTDVAHWDLSDTLLIKNIGAARITKQLGVFDFTNTGLSVLAYGFPGNNHGWNDDSAQYSEETHLEGRSLGGKLDWLIGGFLLFNHPLGYTSEVFDALGASAYDHLRETDRSQAAFVHGIYDLSDYLDGLKFSAGYRYTWDYASLNGSSTKPLETITRGPTGLPTDCFLVLSDRNCAKTIESHYDSPSWNLSLDYLAALRTLVYIRAGNTYHPGGVNPQLPPPEDRFGSEHATDVEIGVKTDWSLGDVSARTNADIFHTDYRSIQVSQPALVPSANPGQPPTTQVVQFNAASAEIEGAEIEQALNLPFGLDLSGEGAYFNAHYNNYPPQLGGGSPQFQYVPRFAYSLTATYHLPVDESWGKMSAGLTWSWTGHQSISPLTEEPINGIPHYDNLDLHADWTDIFSQPVDAAFFMTNATDNLYLTGVSPLMTVVGITSGSYNPPRMFGFSLKYRFEPSG